MAKLYRQHVLKEPASRNAQIVRYNEEFQTAS